MWVEILTWSPVVWIIMKLVSIQLNRLSLENNRYNVYGLIDDMMIIVLQSSLCAISLNFTGELRFYEDKKWKWKESWTRWNYMLWLWITLLNPLKKRRFFQFDASLLDPPFWRLVKNNSKTDHWFFSKRNHFIHNFE